MHIHIFSYIYRKCRNKRTLQPGAKENKDTLQKCPKIETPMGLPMGVFFAIFEFCKYFGIFWDFEREKHILCVWFLNFP